MVAVFGRGLLVEEGVIAGAAAAADPMTALLARKRSLKGDRQATAYALTDLVDRSDQIIRGPRFEQKSRHTRRGEVVAKIPPAASHENHTGADGFELPDECHRVVTGYAVVEDDHQDPRILPENFEGITVCFCNLAITSRGSQL
jgi:hypothetical protein